MPPTDSHVAREFAALKGAALRFSICEKKQKGHFGIAFLFPKSFQKGRFYVLFASAKRTKKQTEGRGPLDSRRRFKALYRNVFDRICSFPCLKQLLGFEPVRKGSCTANARTRQKFPVASFDVSETAETGSIVSGCEQDDHVSRRLSLNIRILI